MGLYLLALPKDYRTAGMLSRKKDELESYRDELIPSDEGVSTISIIRPNDLSDLNKTAVISNKLKPKDIAYARLTITGFVFGNRLSKRQAINIIKKHLSNAIESVGIDSKRFIFKTI